MWKINKIVKKGDYLYAVVPEHPSAIKYGYVLHHRVVMENHIGRLLTEEEIVHHINEDKKDNRIENLELTNVTKHNQHHHLGRTFVELVCPNCGINFKREKRQIKKGSKPKCSRRCNGQYSKKIQMGVIKTSQE